MESNPTCLEEITLTFVDAKLSIGCKRIRGHSSRHSSAEDNIDVSIKADWRTAEPSKPTTAYVYVEWDSYESD